MLHACCFPVTPALSALAVSCPNARHNIISSSARPLVFEAALRYCSILWAWQLLPSWSNSFPKKNEIGYSHDEQAHQVPFVDYDHIHANVPREGTSSVINRSSPAGNSWSTIYFSSQHCPRSHWGHLAIQNPMSWNKLLVIPEIK